jgi:hypothetical protein
MSLVGLALRIVTAKALAGKTFAGERVYDSQIAPLDALENGAAPLIVIYTDDEEDAISGGDLFAPDRSLALMIHTAVATQVAAKAGSLSVEIPHTDEGLEATLDLMRFDIIAALQSGEDVWCDLWRRLVVNKKTMSVRRGASARKGLRFAARELVLIVDTVGEPSPGINRDLWDDVDAALRSDADLIGVADLIASRVRIGASWLDWRQTAAVLGLSRLSSSALGIAPIDEPSAEDVFLNSDGSRLLTSDGSRLVWLSQGTNTFLNSDSSGLMNSDGSRLILRG